MDYLDTSLIVAVLTNEVATGPTQAWLAGRPVQELYISEWVLTEVSSALSIKVRVGEISVDRRAMALGFFRQMAAESFTILPLSSSHFHAAARLSDQHELVLRAGDALHLAVAVDAGARLCTLDKRLSEAGRKVGASVLLLPSEALNG